MNILHAIGCIATGAIASIAAVPIGFLCGSCGFLGMAALFGAAAVVLAIHSCEKYE